MSTNFDDCYRHNSKKRKTKQHGNAANKQTYRRHFFTSEDDETLRDLVNVYGDRDWKFIALKMKNRNARQCRDRWINYLSPDITDVAWTQEDDMKMLELMESFGNKWSVIQKYFIGRSEVNIKNRMNFFKHHHISTIAAYTLEFGNTQEKSQKIMANERKRSLRTSKGNTSDSSESFADIKITENKFISIKEHTEPAVKSEIDMIDESSVIPNGASDAITFNAKTNNNDDISHNLTNNDFTLYNTMNNYQTNNYTINHDTTLTENVNISNNMEINENVVIAKHDLGFPKIGCGKKLLINDFGNYFADFGYDFGYESYDTLVKPAIENNEYFDF